MIKLVIPEFLKECETKIRETIKLSNRITFKLEETKPWDSKLGGCPYLEDIKNYPMDSEGNPMLFIAQINLSDLIELNDLPSSGLLQFFVVNDDMQGLESPIVVKYIENYSTQEENLVKENPFENDKEYKNNLPFIRNGKIYFELEEVAMSYSLEKTHEIFKEEIEKFKGDKTKFDELCNLFNCSESRVGGYPYFLQGDLLLDDDTFLLLQLDLDDTCDIMFGDSGNCNFFISKEDLKNKNFSNVIYDWQCC